MFFHFFKTKIFLFAEILILTIVLVGFWNINVKKKAVDKEIASLAHKAASVKSENEQLQERLKRTEADAYIEMEARRKLNYSKQGESVFVFYEDTSPLPEELPQENKKTSFVNNPSKWFNYFFPQ